MAKRTVTSTAPSRLSAESVKAFGQELERFRRGADPERRLSPKLAPGPRKIVVGRDGKISKADLERLRAEELAAEKKKRILAVRPGTRPRWDKKEHRWKAELVGQERGRGRPSRRGQPSLSVAEFSTSAGEFRPVSFVVDDAAPERVLARERHLLLLRAEFAWMLRWLDSETPPRLKSESTIRAFLSPLGFSEEWEFARSLAEHRRARRAWTDLASEWVYRIERSREPTARFEVERWIEKLEKRVRRGSPVEAERGDKKPLPILSPD